jgi:hypothetical protein
MAALSGTTRYVDITEVHEQEYIERVLQTFQTTPNKMRMLHGFFGGITGFGIAYTPDLTVLFDLQGNFVGTTADNSLPGHCSVSLR